MCGRYTFFNNIDSLKHSLDIDVIDENIIGHQASYNIAPTQHAPVIFQDNKKRILKNMRWGLTPSWAKDDSYSSKLINARLETINVKPSFRNLISTNRCIVLANGYYEWLIVDNKKEPYFIYDRESSITTMAGLWSTWEDITSFTIITKKSDLSISHLHHRMPLIIQEENIQHYLDTNNTIDNFIEYDDIKLKYHQVSNFVNSPKNNSASCIDPLEK